MIREIFQQLMKDKFAKIALIVLGIIYFALFFADFIAPYTKDFSDRTMAYVPPSKIFVIDENGKFSKPYTYNYTRSFDNENLRIVYNLDRSQKHYVKFFAKGQPYKFLGIIPASRHLVTTDSDGRLFLLGTDINGRDVFSRLLFGGRISMTIGFLALFVLFPIGLLYGGIAGYFGGIVDTLMMRFAEAIMSIPSFYLLIILASILPAGMTSVQRFILIVVILAMIGWAGFARVVRGMVLSIKNQEFVQAAKSIGASRLRIIVKHILPQTASFVIVAMTLSVPSYILSESGLSFLGLGIQQPDASWGNMLKEAQEYTNIIYRPWLLTPEFSIFIRVLMAVLLGFAVGLEREMTNKYAGLRTNILVCVGACVFTILSVYGFPTFANGDNVLIDHATGIRDTSRVAAQVVTGIGFIGGGTVLRHGATIFGITTAATLWMAASIGMACGTGMFLLAVIATVLTVLVLISVRFFEKNVLIKSTKNLRRLKINLTCGNEFSNTIYDFIVDKYPNLHEISKKQSKQDDNLTKINVIIDINDRKPLQSTYKMFQKIEGVESVSIQEYNEV